jgi:hypothetical protein
MNGRAQTEAVQQRSHRSSSDCPPAWRKNPRNSQFAECLRLGVPPIGADRIGPVEVGEREDLEQLGAEEKGERIKALARGHHPEREALDRSWPRP